MVRQGYGLQIYNGNPNVNGVVTKYEGNWKLDKRNGKGVAIF